jgi:hypothetical protein
VDFGWFDCLLPFVVVRARNELRSILLVFFSYLSNPIPNLYVDLVAYSSTLLKSSLIIFSLKMVLFGTMEKLTLERDTCFTWSG